MMMIIMMMMMIIIIIIISDNVVKCDHTEFFHYPLNREI
jgi:hypothetical protein